MIDPEIAALYIAMRTLGDGRVIGVHRLLYHWTLHVGISDFGYDDRYCYHQVAAAIIDMHLWNGDGDPPGRWHKHPGSGRRRNPDTGFIWHESEARDATGNLLTKKGTNQCRHMMYQAQTPTTTTSWRWAAGPSTTTAR